MATHRMRVVTTDQVVAEALFEMFEGSNAKVISRAHPSCGGVRRLRHHICRPLEGELAEPGERIIVVCVLLLPHNESRRHRVCKRAR